ncbi:hypothetical protein ACHRV6_23280 [Flavobacterium sp. FlaQc-51]|uniref:hypothetical protein n=1 Tax=Flavobacterium sp. FlaQc-51 TaxID=3374184 RepID=UPI003756814C
MTDSTLFDENTLTLLKNPIPKFEIIHPSLISVLRANSELNLSNLLAYFFKGDFNSHLKEVFLASIIDLIGLDSEDDFFSNKLTCVRFENLEIIKEYATNTGRIDILIINHDERISKRRAFIIENKLYHEVNNDFDDYFYSVSNDFNIDPNQITIITLSLKEYQPQTPSNIHHVNFLHSDLKKTVLKGLGNDLNLFYDKISGLLLGEYFKHIDDLYLDFSSYENARCYAYYSENRKTINKIVLNAETMFAQNFEDISEKNKKLLFENRTKLEELITLHENIAKSAKEYFIHYTKITERNVQGKDYFRGRGFSYDAIRYKLDFHSHLKDESPIIFEVWINHRTFSENKIDMKSFEIETILNELDAKIPTEIKENEWLLVKKEKLQIDKTILSNILKNDVDENWRKLESFLSHKIEMSQIDIFNEKLIDFLEKKSLDITNRIGKIHFSCLTNSANVKYSIKFSPPDLIEIILYVYASSWDEVAEVVRNEIDKEFICFSNKQSYQISNSGSGSIECDSDDYDALLKKSFRIKPSDDLSTILELERVKWIKKEKRIKDIIEKDYPKTSVHKFLKE